MRWDLIEKFTVLKKGRFSRAFKSFENREDFQAVPETLLVEMIAQCGGVLFGLGLDFKKEVILAKIPRAIFPKLAVLPCCLDVEARIEQESEMGARVSGVVRNGRDVVAEAEIFLVTMEYLVPDKNESVVFGKNFFKHYDIEGVVKKSEALV